MFSLDLKLKKWVWIGGIALFLLACLSLSSFFSKGDSSSGATGLLIAGVLLGLLIMFLLGKIGGNRTVVPTESSHTMVESIRKVFKIVCAEGQFNELYNFEETKKLFGILPSTKRALVIINAKVMVGYDFEKCVWEMNEETKKIKLVSFPSPQILSIETDYKYYNFEENIFNLLGREDLTRIQTNGKKQVEQAALNSHLPRIAADQMRTLLQEVVQSKSWQIEDSFLIAAPKHMWLQPSKGGGQAP